MTSLLVLQVHGKNGNEVELDQIMNAPSLPPPRLGQTRFEAD